MTSLQGGQPGMEDDAIVDLHHEDRHCERQQVYEEGQRRAAESRPKRQDGTQPRTNGGVEHQVTPHISLKIGPKGCKINWARS